MKAESENRAHDKIAKSRLWRSKDPRDLGSSNETEKRMEKRVDRYIYTYTYTYIHVDRKERSVALAPRARRSEMREEGRVLVSRGGGEPRIGPPGVRVARSEAA